MHGHMLEGWKHGSGQLIVSLAVVASFLLASAVTWFRATTIDADVDDIVGNAMPSVQFLAAARTDLHRLQLEVDAYVAAAHPNEQARLEMEGTRKDLDASLGAYAALPFFASERELYSHTRDALAAFDRDLGRTVEAVDHAEPSAATSLHGVHRTLDVVDRSLSRIITFDAAQGQRLGLSVANTRRSTSYSALVLNGVALALAVISTVLTFRAGRERVRALEHARDAAVERATASEERSTELEQFAGRVAHDVLSPLMGVGMALDLAKARLAADPRAQESIDRGTRSLLRTRRIVDGLLDFARAGAKPAEGASAEVGAVIADVAEGASADAEAAGIELVHAPAPEPGCTVACSQGALTSVVANVPATRFLLPVAFSRKLTSFAPSRRAVSSLATVASGGSESWQAAGPKRKPLEPGVACQRSGHPPPAAVERPIERALRCREAATRSAPRAFRSRPAEVGCVFQAAALTAAGDGATERRGRRYRPPMQPF